MIDREWYLEVASKREGTSGFHELVLVPVEPLETPMWLVRDIAGSWMTLRVSREEFDCASVGSRFRVRFDLEVMA